MNCTNSSRCEINNTQNFLLNHLFYLLIISVSFLGVIFNSMSAFILTFSQNSNSKFLRFLKYYSYNSLAISFIDFLFCSSHLYSVRSVYKFNQKIHFVYESSVIYYIVYTNTWALLYTFSGILVVMCILVVYLYLWYTYNVYLW